MSELHRAITEGNTEKVERLLAEGADVNERYITGTTPLMFAISTTMNLDTINLLLNLGADVNAQNNDGYTALILAVSNDNMNRFYVVNRLLDCGADKTLKDKYGRTALDYVEKFNYPNVMKMLLEDDTAPKKDDDECVECGTSRDVGPYCRRCYHMYHGYM